MLPVACVFWKRTLAFTHSALLARLTVALASASIRHAQADEKALASAQAAQRSLQERAQALRTAVREARDKVAASQAADAEARKEVAAKRAEVQQLQGANRRAT